MPSSSVYFTSNPAPSTCSIASSTDKSPSLNFARYSGNLCKPRVDCTLKFNEPSLLVFISFPNFVLKPANLRYVPTTVPAPEPQDPKLSYATRTVKSDFYHFNI